MAKSTPSKGAHKDPATAERWAKALEYRKAGVAYAVIAERLGYADHTGARYAVEKAIATLVREPAEEVRTLELERLDRMMLGLYEKATKGHEGAVDRVLRIMDRRAKLLGLDHAPKDDTRQAIHVNIVRGNDGRARPDA